MVELADLGEVISQALMWRPGALTRSSGRTRGPGGSEPVFRNAQHRMARRATRAQEDSQEAAASVLGAAGGPGLGGPDPTQLPLDAGSLQDDGAAVCAQTTGAWWSGEWREGPQGGFLGRSEEGAGWSLRELLAGSVRPVPRGTAGAGEGQCEHRRQEPRQSEGPAKAAQSEACPRPGHLGPEAESPS